MAKDTNDEVEEKIDDKIGAEGGDDKDQAVQVAERPAKMSIRESIQAAVKEVEKDNSEEDKQKDKKSDILGDKDKTRQSKQKTTDSGDVAEKDKQEVKEEIKDKVSKSKESEIISADKQKLKPPPGWTKEGKAAWDTLPADVQKSVVKREDEVSKGIAQYSSKAKAYDELDKAIAPFRPAIQQFGVSEAETIYNLFQWMNALGNPNKAQKVNAFKVLAQSYGVDFSQLAPKQDNQQENEEVQTQELSNQPPEWFFQFANQTQSEINQIKQQKVLEGQAAAQNLVANWAKDKPHFEAVKEKMYTLINGGTIPLVNGMVDLDGAYKAACLLHPEVSELITEEKQERIRQEIADKKAKDAKAKADQIAKAKNAGIGLRPGASIGNIPSNIQAKSNSKLSVRDSLTAAIAEVRDR